MTCLNLQTMNELIVCYLPAFGSKRQLGAYLHVSVSMQPPPVASNPGFPSRTLSHSFGENLQAARDKMRDRKLGFEATLIAENKLSKSVLETSG